MPGTPITGAASGYTPTSVVSTTGPADTEGIDAADVNVPFQDLADALEYLRTRGPYVTDNATTWELAGTYLETGSTAMTRIYHGPDGTWARVHNATWDAGGPEWTQDDGALPSVRERYLTTGVIRRDVVAAGIGAPWAEGAWVNGYSYDATTGILRAEGGFASNASAALSTYVTAGTYVQAGTKYITANTNLNHGSGSATVRDITGNGGKVIGYEIFGSTQTTDAVTTQTAITFAMPADKAVHIRTSIIGIDSTYALGYRCDLIDAYRKAGAAAPIQTTGGTAVVSEDLADGITPALRGWAVSGNDLVFQLQGDAGTTINYQVRAEITMIG